MDRAVHAAGLLADVLHDVDLAARGPPDVLAVLGKHPEGGPQALPARDLKARLYAAVPPPAHTFRLQSSRRVVTAAEPLTSSLDDQVAALYTRVLGAVGVELELAVPPAVAADLPHPSPGVEGRAVELVVPHELPAGDRGCGSPGEKGGHTHEERKPCAARRQRHRMPPQEDGVLT